jgi:branched-subunit amino acid aminotransferase/4-amino-4-deoxychorismate lyase
MSVSSIYRWRDGKLEPIEYCDMTLTIIESADSFLVSNGTVLGLDLHRKRFMTSIARHRFTQVDPGAFWDAALASIPREGDWFPRFELQSTMGSPRLIFRLRSAPELKRSTTVATWTGKDPRTVPTVKGPDLERMTRIRGEVQKRGAEEAVLLSPDGYVAEGAYSGLLWWRGNILCGPSEGIERVDSVTARTLLTLAGALGVDTWDESVTPPELDGTELWAVNALHGIRIVTSWVDGPAVAELPGRLETWRKRLDVLRKPLEVSGG